MIGWQALYAHARRMERREAWSAAAATYERLRRLGEGDNPRVVFRLGHTLFRAGRLDEAVPVLEHATRLDPARADWQYRLGFVLERRKRYVEAADRYRRALSLAANERWRHRLAACEAALANARLEQALKAKVPTWQLIEVLEEGSAACAGDPDWAARLGDARLRMGRWNEAAEAYALASRLLPDSVRLAFREGWAREEGGDRAGAERCYRRALANEESEEIRALGVGAYFQAAGRWRLAAEHYASRQDSAPRSVELSYRLGLARQKSYDWAGAVEALEAGTAIDPSAERLYWRLGLSWERLGNPARAEAAYSRALHSPGDDHAYWKYRLGYVLHLQGRHREACIAFLLSRKDPAPAAAHDGTAAVAAAAAARNDTNLEQALERNLADAQAAQSADLCHRVGLRAEAAGFARVAAAAYEAAVERTEQYNPNRWFRLGRALTGLGRYPEACAAFLETRQFKRPHGVDTVPYMRQKHHRQIMPYTEYLETLALRRGTILYESGHGAVVGGNPLHLCRAVLADVRFHGFRHVWVLNNREHIPAEFAGRSDFVFVARDSDLYLRYLASAEYLVNDNTFPPYFIRREGQQYLNTWHGTPLKTLGRDIRGGVLEHRNAARNFLHATHMIAPNRFTADCLIDRYDVAGLFAGRIALTGYPRIDAVIGTSGEEKARLRRRLNVTPGRKVVLYAPTWRGSLASRAVDEERLRRDVGALAGGNWHLLYRGHTMTGPGAGTALQRHAVPADIDTNDLLAVVDLLITDYSSIFFDFIPTGRPIIHYAYDLEDYREQRGLYFDLEEMPGTVCRSLPEVLEAGESLLASAQHAVLPMGHLGAREKFCPREDGAASQRVLEFFFFGSTADDLPNRSDNRRNVLMFQGSFLPNGITTSYLNLTSHLDRDENNVYVVVDPEALASRPERLEKFAGNPDHVRVLGRVGAHVLTPEERWVIDKFNSQHDVDSEEMWAVIDRAFAREFRRVFGAGRFDSVICFEGYARFWTALLGCAPPGSRKTVWLHNDMHREWRTRFEYLEGNFRLYRRFDALASVTESVAEENARSLAGRFRLDPESFTFCNNLINPDETVRLAEEALDADIAAFAAAGGPLFVTAGRLSPEKGHARLIKAFAAVNAEHPQTRLAILGDGPLHQSLTALVRQLGLTDKVMLAGRRANPFPALKRADCFVFSSEYEGQGLAVLEALILRLPVISTDVVGPRSVLKDGYGLLVEDGTEGLAGGMRRFLEGTIPQEPFDYEVYQKDALARFAAVAL